MGIWQRFERLVSVVVILGAPALTVLLPGNAEAQPRDEKEWERIYCDGMERQKYLPTGGFVDCLSPEFAIEVDWSDKWAEAVGQSLYYAAATDRKPGIILLCEESEGEVEGLCRSYVYRLEYALKHVSVNVSVWMCAIDSDRKLGECFRPELQQLKLPISGTYGSSEATCRFYAENRSLFDEEGVGGGDVLIVTPEEVAFLDGQCHPTSIQEMDVTLACASEGYEYSQHCSREHLH